FSAAAFSVIRHFGRFVHFPAQTVTYEFANHAVTVTFGEFLNSVSYVFGADAHSKLADAYVKRVFGNLQQLPRFRSNVTYCKRNRVLSVQFVFYTAAIYRFDVAFLSRSVCR